MIHWKESETCETFQDMNLEILGYGYHGMQQYDAMLLDNDAIIHRMNWGTHFEIKRDKTIFKENSKSIIEKLAIQASPNI